MKQYPIEDIKAPAYLFVGYRDTLQKLRGRTGIERAGEVAEDILHEPRAVESRRPLAPRAVGGPGIFAGIDDEAVDLFVDQCQGEGDRQRLHQRVGRVGFGAGRASRGLCTAFLGSCPDREGTSYGQQQYDGCPAINGNTNPLHNLSCF